MSMRQITVRLSDRELDALDAAVAAGRSHNRSDAIRRQVAQLARRQRAERDAQVIAEATAGGKPLYPDLEGMFDAFQYPAVD
jgi:Arc/MetJ-type ribon-helix-helix transcriptional regulator